MLADAQSPLSVQLVNQLDLITAWTSMHLRILERFANQQYFGFDRFIRSNDYSRVFLEALGLSLNDVQGG